MIFVVLALCALALVALGTQPVTNSAAISVVEIHQNTDMTLGVTFAIAVTCTDNLSTIAWKVQGSTNFMAGWFDFGPTNVLNIWIVPAGAGTVSMVVTQTVQDTLNCPGAFYRGVVVRAP